MNSVSTVKQRKEEEGRLNGSRGGLKGFFVLARMDQRSPGRCTMVQNREKHRKHSHLIIHIPTSEGASERMSERSGCESKVSKAEQANE